MRIPTRTSSANKRTPLSTTSGPRTAASSLTVVALHVCAPHHHARQAVRQVTWKFAGASCILRMSGIQDFSDQVMSQIIGTSPFCSNTPGLHPIFSVSFRILKFLVCSHAMLQQP